jgi:putative ABC transport system permease protein
MHPDVEQVNEAKPMEDTDADKVRSVQGVSWAVPITYDFLNAKLASGDYKQVVLLGLDTATVVGRPSEMIAGNTLIGSRRPEEIRQVNAPYSSL